MKAWVFAAFAGGFGVTTATVVVNPGGIVTDTVNVAHEEIQKVVTNETGTAPSLGSCGAHH